jgi:hypothetical protein
MESLATIDYYFVDRSPSVGFVPQTQPQLIDISPRVWFVPQPLPQLVAKHPDVYFVEIVVA